MKYEKSELMQFVKLFSDKNSFHLNRFGNVNLSHTLKKHGFSPTNSTVAGIVRAKALELGFKIHAEKSKIHGMPFVGGTFNELYMPAVYGIVNRVTGRMYIGSSIRPDLRRATHLYWLNNVKTHGASNIFFGCKQLRKDLERHGVSSFYIQILEKFPIGTTSEELREAEDRHIKALPENMLYNMSKQASGTNSFIPLYDARKPKYEAIKAKEAEMLKVLRAKRAEHKQIRRQNRSAPNIAEIRAELNREIEIFRSRYNAAIQNRVDFVKAYRSSKISA
jgi:group I intron endonuclease